MTSAFSHLHRKKRFNRFTNSFNNIWKARRSIDPSPWLFCRSSVVRSFVCSCCFSFYQQVQCTIPQSCSSVISSGSFLSLPSSSHPNDSNHKIALSSKKGLAKLFFFHNRAPKNTLNKNSGLGAKSVKMIKTDTLDNIIKKSKKKIKEIDFLTIDVEGNELEVLKGFNIKKYKPKVISIELINRNINSFYEQDIKVIQKSKIYKYMINRNYKLANWIHDDLIFVSKKLLKSR